MYTFHSNLVLKLTKGTLSPPEGRQGLSCYPVPLRILQASSASLVESRERLLFGEGWLLG